MFCTIVDWKDTMNGIESNYPNEEPLFLRM